MVRTETHDKWNHGDVIFKWGSLEHMAMAESLSLQADDLSLAELFQKGLDTQKEVECGELPSNSKEFQVSDLWTHLYSNDSGQTAFRKLSRCL